MIEISTELVGLLASLTAGIFTLIPALGATDQRRALTALVTITLGVLLQHGLGFASWSEFGETLATAAIYAVVSYKLVLQPLVLPTIAKAVTKRTTVYAAQTVK